jgi:GTP:adenosylcobinamide-phosphate guanylyltransferase
MSATYFQCACHTPYHALVVERDPDLPTTFNVEIISTKNASFWHRVKYALRHVFVPEMLVEADLVLDEKTALELAAMIGGWEFRVVQKQLQPGNPE